MTFKLLWSKKIIFAFIVVILVTTGVLSAYKGPRIQFDKEVWDFGKTKQGKILNHVFKFRNTGDTTLLIKNVRTSCGCAAALVSDKEIPPNKNGEVKVTFNTRGYGGKVSKYIYIESNDPDQPTKQLTVIASIDVPPQPKISLDRYSIDLGLILESEKLQTSIAITNIGELELSVDLSHKNAGFFIGNKQVNAPIKLAARKRVKVDFKLAPAKKMGLLREYILIKTNDPMRPNLSFYVSGYIVTKNQLKDLFKKYKDILK